MRSGLLQMFALIQQLYMTNYTDQSDFDGQDSGHTFGGDVRLSLLFHDPDARVAQLFAGRRRRPPPNRLHSRSHYPSLPPSSGVGKFVWGVPSKRHARTFAGCSLPLSLSLSARYPSPLCTALFRWLNKLLGYLEGTCTACD